MPQNDSMSRPHAQSNFWSQNYVNQMVSRDTDTSGTGLTASGDGYSRVWPVADANFNTVALVVMSDGSATVGERYSYDPFGTVTYMTGSYGSEDASAYEWVYLFQGGRLDTITGDTNFDARNENSALGTWTSEDPLGFEGGTADLSDFLQNEPINAVDPDGLLTIKCTGITSKPIGERSIATYSLATTKPVKQIGLTLSYLVQRVIVYYVQKSEELTLAQVQNLPKTKVVEYYEAWPYDVDHKTADDKVSWVPPKGTSGEFIFSGEVELIYFDYADSPAQSAAWVVNKQYPFTGYQGYTMNPGGLPSTEKAFPAWSDVFTKEGDDSGWYQPEGRAFKTTNIIWYWCNGVSSVDVTSDPKKSDPKKD